MGPSCLEGKAGRKLFRAESAVGVAASLLRQRDRSLIELSHGREDVSMPSLWKSPSVRAQWGPCRIELSGINERVLPRRPEPLLSLFVIMNVFTAAL